MTNECALQISEEAPSLGKKVGTGSLELRIAKAFYSSSECFSAPLDIFQGTTETRLPL